ncbi:hypothetical protein [Thermocatellispora tengchongensis]|uniref:hypothetical protein n=1 Tax=Thermocatellispora tengchongensis TaxID=1073253 RepID=UPI003638E8F6
MGGLELRRPVRRLRERPRDPAEPERPQSLVPERLRRQGLRLLEPQRALGVLGQVLADDETVLSVADVDWPRFSAVFNAMRSWPLLEEIPEARQIESGPGGTAVVTSGRPRRCWNAWPECRPVSGNGSSRTWSPATRRRSSATPRPTRWRRTGPSAKWGSTR